MLHPCWMKFKSFYNVSANRSPFRSELNYVKKGIDKNRLKAVNSIRKLEKSNRV